MKSNFKSKLWLFVAMHFMMLGTVWVLSSCSGEDEKEFMSDLTQYKWVSRTDQFSTGNILEYDKYVYTLYFVSSTEGILRTNWNWIDSTGDDDFRTENTFFTYTVKGNKVNINQEDGSSWQLTITDKGLLKDDHIYTKESLTSTDHTFIAQENLNHQYYGNLNFGYDIGFNDFMNIAPQRNSDGTYSHTIHMTYGIPAEMLRRGVREFGIAVDVENGTVENATNKTTDDAYVKKRYVNGKNVTTFTTNVPDNNKHTWGVLLSVKSKSKDVLLKHAVVLNVGDMKIGDKYSSYFKRCDYDNKYVYRVGWVEDRYSFGGSSGSGDGNSDGNGNSAKYENGHEYIDLGLSVKWATCNVGASRPEEYGGYYAWGETTTKSSYTWDNLKYCDPQTGVFSKYTENGLSTLVSTDDVAYKNWGGKWRMPTLDQLQELINNCYWEWTSNYMNTDVPGYMVFKTKYDADKGKKRTEKKAESIIGAYSLNDAHIFLPLAGRITQYGKDDVNKFGYYWTSSRAEYFEKYAESLDLASHVVDWLMKMRYYGMSVRPVCP